MWADNFAEESWLLNAVAPSARHVALNVQYPGCVVGPIENHRNLTAEERYKVIRGSVALLKPLQVGIAVRTDDGRRFAWEFNLREFDVFNSSDPRDPESIAYLAACCCVNFRRLRRDGVPGYWLRWLLRDSGLIRARPSWATFSGAYHVAYFVSVSTGEKLPDGVDAFVETARRIIGSSASLYDVKLLAREHDKRCVGALTHVVKKLAVVPGGERISKSKPAGTSSMLALLAFETLMHKHGGN